MAAVTEIDWAALIANARMEQPVAVVAQTFHGVLRDQSWKPILVGCSDQERYAVKALGIEHEGRPAGRVLFNEYVAGSLGALLGAPVPAVRLVELPDAFISQYGLQPRVPGLAYGLRYIPDSDPAGRPDSAHCALFLEWTAWSPGDLQFILQRTTGRPYIIDYGNYLGGPDAPRQAPAAPTLRLDMSQPEAQDAIARLRSVTPAQIAAIIAAAPDAWGISDAERIQIAMWLYERQQQLLQLNAAG